jgi:hypothetical protein
VDEPRRERSPTGGLSVVGVSGVGFDDRCVGRGPKSRHDRDSGTGATTMIGRLIPGRIWATIADDA